MSPALLIVLGVIALVAVAYFAGLRPAPVRGRKPTPGILRRRSKWRKVLPIIPLLGAVGCLVYAFSGFRFNVEETSPVIVLVMDVSNSMDATDVEPNRLAAAEDAANAFLDELPPKFRVGLATFAGEAKLVVDPTPVRGEVVDALAGLTTSRGTVIGDGLTEALDAIEEIRLDAPDTPAAALLLSDGQRHGEPRVPRPRPRREPHRSTFRCSRWSSVRSPRAIGPGADLGALEAIANTSGGDTFTAETSDELTTIYANLGSELSVELDVEPSTTPFVIAAIALTVLSGSCSSTRPADHLTQPR